MSDVELERISDDVAVLRLNRPEKLNALSWDLVRELHGVLDEIAADSSLRVVVLTGAGRGFCAGLDLTQAHLGSPLAAGTTGPRATMRSQADIAALVPHMRRIPQPVIAAVNGPAYGGGMALGLGCDIRVASESARFCTQFIKVGVSGCDIGVSYLLPRLVGGARAHELILTARTIDAAEAERIGLVTRVVADTEVVAAAVEIAETICAYAPFAVEMTKEVMWANLDSPGLEHAIALENRTQALAGTGGEILEAASAFMEKRPPKWR